MIEVIIAVECVLLKGGVAAQQLSDSLFILLVRSGD